MWLQFLLQNAHFAINVFASLVFFAIFWLYFDAWTADRSQRSTIRFAGFLCLSISFLLHAILVESTLLDVSILSRELNSSLTIFLRLAGYGLVSVSLIIDPIQPRPKVERVLAVGIGATPAIAIFSLLQPLFAAGTAFLYLHRSTLGLEHHLRQKALGFLVLTFAELVSLASLFEVSQNVRILELASSFGPLWLLEHLLYFVASLILARWVFGYLFKRFFSQMFIIYISTILVIFLITTITFTGLLLSNLQTETVKQLETDVRVLEFSLESKRNEVISDAQLFAGNPQIIAALEEKDRKSVAIEAEKFLLAKKHALLIVVNHNGQVIARGEDRERIGDSLSEDPLVIRILLNKANSTVVVKDGVIAPEVSVRGAAPILSDGKVIGGVIIGVVVDTAFADGIKAATGLETAIYGGTQVSATTLTESDEKTRLTGMKLLSPVVQKTVLEQNKSYAGSIDILTTPYFGAYLPLLDVDTNPAGMLFVGRPQSDVLKAAARSIELTFISTVILMIFAIIPSYFIARSITKQVS